MHLPAGHSIGVLSLWKSRYLTIPTTYKSALCLCNGYTIFSSKIIHFTFYLKVLLAWLLLWFKMVSLSRWILLCGDFWNKVWQHSEPHLQITGCSYFYSPMVRPPSQQQILYWKFAPLTSITLNKFANVRR